MLIQSSTILALPVAAMDSQGKVGHVKQIVIDPENGTLLGYSVKPIGLFTKDKILSQQDVVEIDKNGIVIRSEDDLLEPEEIIRINKIIKSNVGIIGQDSFTESKKFLGKVFDYILDTETQSIVKYYIRNIFDEKIFPQEKVVEINKRGIFFSNDVIEQISKVEPEGAAA